MITQSIAKDTSKPRIFRFTLHSPKKGSRFLFVGWVAFPLILTSWTFSEWIEMEGTQLMITLLVTFILLLNTFFFARRANVFGTNHALLIEGDRFALLKGAEVIQEEWIGNLQMCLFEDGRKDQAVVPDAILIRGPRFVPVRIESPGNLKGRKQISNLKEEKVWTTATTAEWEDLRQVLCMLENVFYDERSKAI